MSRIRKIVMVLSLAFLSISLAQCKKGIVEQQSGNNTYETIEVFLNVDNGGGSKTDISTSGIVTWEVGDVLHVVGETDGYLGDISAQNTSVSAYFTGSITKPTTATQDFHFYYTGSQGFTLTDNTYFTYDISQQTGKLADIAENLHLMHGEINDVTAGTTNLGTITMTSMMSIINLTFSRYDEKALKSSVKCNGGFSRMKFDVKKGAFDGSGNPVEGVVRTGGEITLSDIATEGAAVGNYYMAVIPGEQALEFTQSFVWKSCASNNFLANKLYNGDEAKDIEMERNPCMIPGEFSVAEGRKVVFSKGNLQYIGSTAYWKFADNQYTYIGTTQATDLVNVNRDLFGWGTSGYNGKHPSMTSITGSNYGNGNNDIAGTNYDWGVYNNISNDGRFGAGAWRTLTSGEWVYVISRKDESGKLLYGEGTVVGKNGLIILPDDWTLPVGLSFIPGKSAWANIYDSNDWAEMEKAGAVFLPAAGLRDGTSMDAGYVNVWGYYWSSSKDGDNTAKGVCFCSNAVNSAQIDNRSRGCSVRLVKNVE